MSVPTVLASEQRSPSSQSAPQITFSDSPTNDSDPGRQGESPDIETQRLTWFQQQRSSPTRTTTTARTASAMLTAAPALVTTNTLLQWNLLGPRGVVAPDGQLYGGAVTALAVHPTNSNIVYLGASTGGVWKTTDGGLTWIPLTDAMPDLTVSALAIDPSNPEVVYWGTWDRSFQIDRGAGVYKSTDGGTSWAYVGLEGLGVVKKIVVDPTNSQRVYVANWTGVYQSPNSGATWTKIFSASHTGGGTEDWYTVAVHPTVPNVLYVGAPFAGGVYRSDDGGATWTFVLSTVVTIGGLQSYGLIFLDIPRAQPESLYCTSLKKLYTSQNRGASWVTHDAPAFSYGLFAVNPANPNIIFLAGAEPYRSTDGGVTWAKLTSMHEDYHAIAFAPSQPSIKYVGNDGGVWKVTNWPVVGLTTPAPTNLNQSLAIAQFYAVGVDAQQPPRIYGGAQDLGVLYTNGDLQWNQLVEEGDGGAVVVNPTDARIVHTELQGGTHVRCFNTPPSVSCAFLNTGITGPSAWIAPLIMSPLDPQTLFTATTAVFKTTNGQDSWNPISPTWDNTKPLTGLAIDPQNPQILYATAGPYNASVGGGLYRTLDGGSTWTNVRSSQLPDRWITKIVVDPTTPTTVYLTFSGFGTGHVFKSLDRGDTWQDISGNLPIDSPVNVLVVSPLAPNQLLVGTDSGLFLTKNGGVTWEKSTGLPNTIVQDVTLMTDSGVISVAAATYGRSMWKATLVDLKGPPPPIKFLAPKRGDIVNGLYTIRVKATSASVQYIRIFLDGQSLFSIIPPLTSFPWDTTTIVNGKHTLKAKAYDEFRNELGVVRVKVTVQN